MRKSERMRAELEDSTDSEASLYEFGLCTSGHATPASSDTDTKNDTGGTSNGLNAGALNQWTGKIKRRECFFHDKLSPNCIACILHHQG